MKSIITRARSLSSFGLGLTLLGCVADPAYIEAYGGSSYPPLGYYAPSYPYGYPYPPYSGSPRWSYGWGWRDRWHDPWPNRQFGHFGDGPQQFHRHGGHHGRRHHDGRHRHR